MSYSNLARNHGLLKGLIAPGVSRFGWLLSRLLFGLLLISLLFSLWFSGSVSANYQFTGRKLPTSPQTAVILLTQSGENAPVISVLRNDFTGVTFEGFYNGPGVYLIYASQPIFNGGTQKTIVMTSTINPVYWDVTPAYVWGGVADGVTTNALHIATGRVESGLNTPQNGLLSQHAFEVTVYP